MFKQPFRYFILHLLSMKLMFFVEIYSEYGNRLIFYQVINISEPISNYSKLVPSVDSGVLFKALILKIPIIVKIESVF